MASARTSRRTRPWTRSTVVAVAALALAGCSATNPIITADNDNVTDGVDEELGPDVAVRNLYVLTEEQGAVGTLIGALVNRGREDVEVTLEPDGEDSVTIDVPARGVVLVGGEDQDSVDLESVAVAPGALLTVVASTPDGGATEIRVPVLDGTLPEYTDSVPQGD